MAAAIIATVGAPDANCYLTLADAESYFEAHAFSTDWDNADADTKTRALITAARLIDEHALFKGRATTSTQRLQWPRCGMRTVTGCCMADTILPERVQQATAELARFLLVSDRTSDTDAEREGLKALTAGPVSLTFDRITTSGERILPDEVIAMLQPWLMSVAGRSIAVPLVRM